jgi:hypothetical protein
MPNSVRHAVSLPDLGIGAGLRTIQFGSILTVSLPVDLFDVCSVRPVAAGISSGLAAVSKITFERSV